MNPLKYSYFKRVFDDANRASKEMNTAVFLPGSAENVAFALALVDGIAERALDAMQDIPADEAEQLKMQEWSCNALGSVDSKDSH